MDNAALLKIGYGLYVLTARENGKDNGCIINAAMQVTSSPSFTGVVCVSKQNYTHGMIMRTKKLNISVLTTETPFELFKHFGFRSGKEADKFADYNAVMRSGNGILYLSKHANAYLSCNVTDAFDFGSHTMFKADITGGGVIGGAESVTYSYYQQYIKPKAQAVQTAGYRCNICGYIHERDVLPEDFICPICKHGASDFTEINTEK